MIPKLEKSKNEIFPQGLSLEEIQNLPDDELNAIAKRAGLTREKMNFLVEIAVLRYKEQEVRRLSVRADAERMRRGIKDRRAQKVRGALLEVIARGDILGVERSKEKQERLEAEGYELLKRFDATRDIDQRKELSSRARELFEKSLWSSPELDFVEVAHKKGEHVYRASLRSAAYIFKGRDRANLPIEYSEAIRNVVGELFDYANDVTLYEELSNAARSCQSGAPSAEAEKTMMRLVLAARSVVLLRKIDSAALKKYGADRYSSIFLRKLASAYKKVAGYPSDARGQPALGSAIAYDVDSHDAGGFGPVSRKSRPRRSPGTGESY
jgi:hypothetical protein